MSTLAGVDASSWQATTTIEAAMGTTGRFLIHKATEGTNFTDPTHAAHVALARKRGWLVGHYHYGHPAMSAARQARFFLSVADPQPGDVIALDLEANEGSWSQRLRFACDFLGTIYKTHRGVRLKAWLYVNDAWLTALHGTATAATWRGLSSYPLWLAYWSGTPGHLPRVPWPVVTCHQYADHPLTDRDVFFGDEHTWDALAVPGPRPAPPTPKPPTPPKPPAPPAVPAVEVRVPGLAAPVTLTLHP